MTTSTERADLRQAAATSRMRSIVWPGAVAVLLFVLIIYIQFSLILGDNGFPAELVLAVGFYYCWSWHNRLAAKATMSERAAEKA
jgi:hypothetical protein